MATKRELELELTLALTYYKLADEMEKQGYHFLAEMDRESGRIYEKLVADEMKNKPYSIKVTINM